MNYKDAWTYLREKFNAGVNASVSEDYKEGFKNGVKAGFTLARSALDTTEHLVKTEMNK